MINLRICRPIKWFGLSAGRTLQWSVIASGAISSALGVVAGAPEVAWALCSPALPCFTSPTDLGATGTYGSQAYGVNADGSVVVGASFDPAQTSAIRWTASGGLIDLGALGGTEAFALGVNANGSVIVGYATTVGNAGGHAFRWTSATGMQDLGTLGGSSSVATGISANGSVIVGYSMTAGESALRAFRWTSAAGMQDIGTLGGDNSMANAVSADGLVIVGQSYASDNISSSAFRWTSAGGMQDLGTLGASYAAATAVNADGTVIVGVSAPTGGNTTAFRWTSTSGMQSLGTLGGSWSWAFGVSGDGNIVVGQSETSCGCPVAFRWTAALGMQNLNTLLANAGVDMTGIVLIKAGAISSNGQFIVGAADFGSGYHAYIVRYAESDAPPIAGLTTFGSVASSLQQLADARAGAMVQQNGLASPLLGGDKPMGTASELGVFASLGSFSAGGHARFAFGNGLAILGGLAYAREELDQVDIRDSLMAAAALQYIHRDSLLGARPFVETGGWIAPNASVTLTRTYENGAGLAFGTGSAHADISYYYGRVGLLYALGRDDQVAVSAEIGRARMESEAYSEPLSTSNPFEAHVSDGTDTMDLAKLKAQWSHRFTSAIDATAWAAAAHDVRRTSNVSAVIPGFGTLASRSGDAGEYWAEYGIRVGYALTEATTVDIFANGVSGPGAIDARIHAGAALRVRY